MGTILLTYFDVLLRTWLMNIMAISWLYGTIQIMANLNYKAEVSSYVKINYLINLIDSQPPSATFLPLYHREGIFKATKFHGSQKMAYVVISMAFNFHGFYCSYMPQNICGIWVNTSKSIFVNQMATAKTMKTCNPQSSLPYGPYQIAITT